MSQFTSLKAVITKKIASLGLGDFMQEAMVQNQTEEFLGKYKERGEIKFQNFKDKVIFLQCSNNIIANELRYMVEPLKNHLKEKCKGVFVRDVYIKTSNTFKRNIYEG